MPNITREPQVDTLSKMQIEELGRLIFLKETMEPSDLFIIFGSQQGDWKKYARYILKNPNISVITTGYKGLETPENKAPLAEYMCSQLILFGVPKSRIIVQAFSTNTLEDAQFSRFLIDHSQLKPQSISFGCLAHHSGRCFLTLKRWFPEALLRPITSCYRQGSVTVNCNNWWKSIIGRGRVLGEYLRIREYAKRGDIMQPNNPLDLDLNIATKCNN